MYFSFISKFILEISYWKNQTLRKIVLLFFVGAAITLQVDVLILVAVPMIFPNIPWNLLPTFLFESSFLTSYEPFIRFFMNLYIFMIDFTNAIFAGVFSMILLIYSLVCCMDFIQRQNQQIPDSGNKVAKFSRALLAYKS